MSTFSASILESRCHNPAVSSLFFAVVPPCLPPPVRAPPPIHRNKLALSPHSWRRGIMRGGPRSPSEDAILARRHMVPASSLSHTSPPRGSYPALANDPALVEAPAAPLPLWQSPTHSLPVRPPARVNGVMGISIAPPPLVHTPITHSRKRGLEGRPPCSPAAQRRRIYHCRGWAPPDSVLRRPSHEDLGS